MESASLVAVAKITKPFGLKGDVAVLQYNVSQNPIKPNCTVYIDESPITVEKVRDHVKQTLVVRFAGYANLDDANTLRGREIFMRTADLPPLQTGRFYHYDLIGSKVRDTAQNEIGELTEIISTPGNDVYVIRDEKKAEILVPATAEAVKNVDTIGKIIIVEQDFCVKQSGSGK